MMLSHGGVTSHSMVQGPGEAGCMQNVGGVVSTEGVCHLGQA